VCGIAAGTTGIDQRIGGCDRDVGREFAHDLRRRSNLTDRFLFHAQASDDRCDQHRGYFATHNLPHQRQHLFMKNLAVLDNASKRLLWCHG